MRRTVKSLMFGAVILFVLTGLAAAQSEYLDSWIGQWNVRMIDDSLVTYDISETWVSDTGKTHIAFGIKSPGDVEFQIYYGRVFSRYFYIEASHDTSIYDLPTDFSLYTELLPAADFKSFTTITGKYPINYGWQGDDEPVIEPDPDMCTASYLLGENDLRLDSLRYVRDEYMATSAAGRNMIKMYYDMSGDIICICEKSPVMRLFLQQMLESVLSD